MFLRISLNRSSQDRHRKELSGEFDTPLEVGLKLKDKNKQKQSNSLFPTLKRKHCCEVFGNHMVSSNCLLLMEIKLNTNQQFRGLSFPSVRSLLNQIGKMQRNQGKSHGPDHLRISFKPKLIKLTRQKLLIILILHLIFLATFKPNGCSLSRVKN